MYQAEFTYSYTRGVSTTKTFTADSAEDFLKLMPKGIKLRTARKCKIGKICVNPREFFNEIYEKYSNEKITFQKILNISEICDFYGLENYNTYLKVTTPPNLVKYEKLFEKLGEYEIAIRYHGTGFQHISSIVDKGLNISKRGALGPGIYVAHRNKADEFASLRNHHDIVSGITLEVECLFGKVHTYTNMDGGLGLCTFKHSTFGEDIDTIYYNGFVRPEWCLKDTSQVLIRKIFINDLMANRF